MVFVVRTDLAAKAMAIDQTSANPHASAATAIRTPRKARSLALVLQLFLKTVGALIEPAHIRAQQCRIAAYLAVHTLEADVAWPASCGPLFQLYTWLTRRSTIGTQPTGERALGIEPLGSDRHANDRPLRAVQYVRMSTEHQRYSVVNQKAAIADSLNSF